MTSLEQTAKFIQSKAKGSATTAIILGSGLGNLSEQIQIDLAISYSEIPNFPVSTVEGHKGRLILGSLNGVKVWVMEGRFHFYEGYTPEQVVFPIRVLHLTDFFCVILISSLHCYLYIIIIYSNC
jgi:purine-nucleoside phosphorylase